MHTGTISDFDAQGQYGLIDADDGRLVPFNLSDVPPPLRPAFGIGARVQFIEPAGHECTCTSSLALLSHSDS